MIFIFKLMFMGGYVYFLVNRSSMVDTALPAETDDSQINSDATFLNELGKLLQTHGKTTSVQMLPHLCNIRSTYVKARRSVKRRIESNGPLRQSLISSFDIR